MGLADNTTRLSLLMILLLAVGAAAAAPATLTGRSINILSGEEFLLLDERNSQHLVRLAGIQTPPLNQPHGAAAKRHLGMLIAGKPISVSYRSEDKRGALIGKIRLAGNDINLRLIQAGLAVSRPAELSEQERGVYAQAQQQARNQGLGIWRSDARLPDRGIHLPGRVIPLPLHTRPRNRRIIH